MEHTKFLRMDGIHITPVRFDDLTLGDMFISTNYDTGIGIKIPNGFYEGYEYNCVDLECGELYYIPKDTQVGMYTQVCIRKDE